MTARLLDGRVVAREVRSKIKAKITSLASSIVEPKLVSILVGDNPASQAYLKNNETALAEVGIKYRSMLLAEGISQDELARLVGELNADGSVTGILIHLPLPKGLNETAMLSAVAKEKDVEGLNPCNLGLLTERTAALVPCTPNGILVLLKYYGLSVSSKHVVIINRSKPVGRPLSQLLLNEDATVTVCHSKTQDLTGISQTADILITGIGRRDEFTVGPSMIRPGAVVVDVGTSNVGGKIVGDVDFDAALRTASYVTPVPGGVGPMTTTMLLYNTVLAACLQSRVEIELGIEELAGRR
jgi:methylenetetrahydrofolate dehydrogenase (NADP+)/methenyltetrahydrofolate cyclohydrolase